MRKLTKEEKDAFSVALNMRTNYIETGDHTIGASDVQARTGGDPRKMAEWGVTIKALSESQMRLILLTKEMLRKIYADEIFIKE